MYITTIIVILYNMVQYSVNIYNITLICTNCIFKVHKIYNIYYNILYIGVNIYIYNITPYYSIGYLGNKEYI
jgi:hypothetical protein